MSLLGIDIGSGRCKGAAFDGCGSIVAQAVRSYDTVSRGGNRVEIDAERFWDAMVAVTREIAAATGRDPVEALAVSSHGETFIPVGKDGRAVGPAVMNADNRAVEEAAWWRDHFGADRVYAITGLPLHAMFALNKIMWLKKHDRDTYSRGVKFLNVADYVLARMAMPCCTDFSLAGRTMAFDIRTKTLSDEILAAAGIGKERFPEPVPAGSVVGRLSRRVAAELELHEGVVVAMGGHDQPCGALGSGAVNPGQVSLSAGTYECAAAVSASPMNSDKAMAYHLNSYCHVVPDRYVTLAFFPAGIATRWFVEQFCGEDRMVAERENRSLYDVLDERAAAACPGPSGICFTPHLVGACNPYWDLRATGALVGLTSGKTRHHLYKALYEGIACELAVNVAALEEVVGHFPALSISGGNARVDLSIQLCADLTGKKVHTLHCSETGCLGAALLAGVAAGVYKDVADAAARAARINRTFLPDASSCLAYAEQFQQYKMLYASLVGIREMTRRSSY